jgi:hypothetical protein
MKKHGIGLIALATMVFVLAPAWPVLQAAPESTAEPVQTNLTATPEPSAGPRKVRGPVDSSLVIPKGPQWLGAPIMPGGATLKQDSGRLITEYNQPYKQLLTWYQGALKDYPDARYRDWEEEMYIEDQGGSKWHSINISKTGGAKTTVTIVKDNWTWIMATLFIRFAGVFIVLLILWACLNISGIVMQRFYKEEVSKK